MRRIIHQSAIHSISGCTIVETKLEKVQMETIIAIDSHFQPFLKVSAYPLREVAGHSLSFYSCNNVYMWEGDRCPIQCIFACVGIQWELDPFCPYLQIVSSSDCRFGPGYHTFVMVSLVDRFSQQPQSLLHVRFDKVIGLLQVRYIGRSS